jgi:aarF domain-containing kinase
MVQGNNQSLSSPVNRVKIIGLWASGSLIASPSLTFTQKLSEYYHYFLFRAVILSLDIAFWAKRVKQLMKTRLGSDSEGFEDQLERAMRGIAKSNFGIEVAPEAFEG